jgi:NAD(P)-dependent dehydrogenase (short-subunit alcohol dehydrogenase family)
MAIDQYRSQIEVHNIGGFLFLRTALQSLLEQEPRLSVGSRYPTRGSIVLLTSLASEGAFIGAANYIAAKFAVKGLMQTAGKLGFHFYTIDTEPSCSNRERR